MRPFLLLSTRADTPAAQGEYEAFRRFGGLAPDELHQVRLERDPMPDLDLDDWSGIVVGGSPVGSASSGEANGLARSASLST